MEDGYKPDIPEFPFLPLPSLLCQSTLALNFHAINTFTICSFAECFYNCTKYAVQEGTWTQCILYKGLYNSTFQKRGHILILTYLPRLKVFPLLFRHLLDLLIYVSTVSFTVPSLSLSLTYLTISLFIFQFLMRYGKSTIYVKLLQYFIHFRP